MTVAKCIILAVACCAAMTAGGPSGAIVFSSAKLGGFALLDVQTHAVTPLNVKGTAAAVSPNGRTLAFVDDKNRLQILDLETRQATALNDGVNYQYSPTFVGNDAVAYIRETRRETNICITPVARFEERVWNGKAPEELATFMQLVWVTGSTVEAPSFVLTGRKSIYLVSPRGSKQLLAADAGVHFRYPAVSPDGRRLLYVVDDGNYDVYALDLAGGSPVRLTKNGSSSWPTWSRDGAHIAFLTTSVVSRGLNVVTTDGRSVGRTAGTFLNSIAVMKPDGSEALALGDEAGKPVLSTGSQIRWR